MPRTRLLVLSCATFALLVLGCGGGSKGGAVNGPGPGPGPVGGGGGTGLMSATVNGVAWTSDPGGVVTVATPGFYQVQGVKAVGGPVQYIILQLYNIGGPGLYPLGVSGAAFGGPGTVGTSTQRWVTPMTGADGVVEITTLTATRIAGTFSFTATPQFGGATGTKIVTNGTFDLPVAIQSGVGALPANAGSFIRMKLNGVPWNAATPAAQYSNSGSNHFLVGGGINSRSMLSINISGLDGAGTFPFTLLPITWMLFQNAVGDSTWGGLTANVGGNVVLRDSGQFVVTSFSASRIAGTFSAKLIPGFGSAATDSIYLTDGSFDFGLPAAPGARSEEFFGRHARPEAGATPLLPSALRTSPGPARGRR